MTRKRKMGKVTVFTCGKVENKPISEDFVVGNTELADQKCIECGNEFYGFVVNPAQCYSCKKRNY